MKKNTKIIVTVAVVLVGGLMLLASDNQSNQGTTTTNKTESTSSEKTDNSSDVNESDVKQIKKELQTSIDKEKVTEFSLAEFDDYNRDQQGYYINVSNSTKNALSYVRVSFHFINADGMEVKSATADLFNLSQNNNIAASTLVDKEDLPDVKKVTATIDEVQLRSDVNVKDEENVQLGVKDNKVVLTNNRTNAIEDVRYQEIIELNGQKIALSYDYYFGSSYGNIGAGITKVVDENEKGYPIVGVVFAPPYGNQSAIREVE
ncbi:MAG: hypothetical protein LBT37_05325 [Lactobacillaceae bacterium]|jgi:hypothetical protein|nr:hypothetical protein [Lactobacillaceae bacterium]